MRSRRHCFALSTTFTDRRRALDQSLRAHPKLLVAFSGGVDSSALLAAAVRALGAPAVLAVTADSPSYPDSDRRDARACAAALGVEHVFVATREAENPLYAMNDSSRCYHCKTELFSVLEPMRAERGFSAIAYGEIADDASDFRPGQRAAHERGVLAPLRDAGFTKDDCRELLRREGFAALAEKPASACLSSRVPYGMPVVPQTLRRIGICEEFLRGRGYRTVRVRHHDTVARLELDAEGIRRLLDPAERDAICGYLKSQGYSYVTLDLQGYRTGSLNETLRST